jgi:hypothetical protein
MFFFPRVGSIARSLARTHSRSAEADFSTERVPRAAIAVRSVASR